MWPETQEKAELEVSLLRQNVDCYRTLIDKSRHTEPDIIEISALATFLHSFYTGVENIFKRIAIEIDEADPSGDRWHSDLLTAMSGPSAKRPAVISSELKAVLGKYLEFRHLFRHAYGFLLKWRRMDDLVLSADQALDELETELRSFFADER